MAGCSVQNLKGPKVINSIVGALEYMHVDFPTLLTLIDRYIVGISLPGLCICGYGGGMKSLVLFEPLSVYLVSCLSGRQSREVRYSFLTEKAHRYMATMDLEHYSLITPYATHLLLNIWGEKTSGKHDFLGVL